MDCCVKTWKTTTDYCLKTTIDAAMPPVLGMLEFAASARQLEAATTRCRVPSQRPYQITNVTVTAAAMPAMSFELGLLQSAANNKRHKSNGYQSNQSEHYIAVGHDVATLHIIRVCGVDLPQYFFTC